MQAATQQSRDKEGPHMSATSRLNPTSDPSAKERRRVADFEGKGQCLESKSTPGPSRSRSCRGTEGVSLLMVAAPSGLRVAASVAKLN